MEREKCAITNPRPFSKAGNADRNDTLRIYEEHQLITTGWQTTCTCTASAPVPAIVLDIFNGAGTTGLVANRLGRRYIGIDLNAEYCRLAVERIQADDRAAAVTTRPLQKSAGVAQLNLFSNGDQA